LHPKLVMYNKGDDFIMRAINILLYYNILVDIGCCKIAHSKCQIFFRTCWGI
jgi:hypothetical protein